MNHLKDQRGVALVLELVLVAVVLAAASFGVYTYMSHKPAAKVATKSSLSPSQSATPTATPDPYAGWKTYTVPEASNISFKYPADWQVSDDLHDNVTNPYNRFVKILAPNKFDGDYFVFRFYYSPGTNNTITQNCHGGDTGNVKNDAVAVSGKALSILTSSSSVNYGSPGTVTSSALDDSSKCYIGVPGGAVQMHGSVGDQGVAYITPQQWNARSEPATFDLIYKSLKF